MAQKTKLYINVPADIGSASWGQQVLKSYLHNAKIVYKRENKKLLGQMKKYGEKIYDLVIAEFYKSYTPAVYDRHGNIKGFNLYSAKNFDFIGLQSGNMPSQDAYSMYGFEQQVNKLLPYYSGWRKIQDGKNDNGEPKMIQEEVGKKYVFLLVLNGIRNLVFKYSKHGVAQKDFTGRKRRRIYTFKVSYSLGSFNKTFNGTPYKIFQDTAEYLVAHYNVQIVKSIRKSLSNIPMRWVD